MTKEILIAKYGNIINHMSCIYLNDGENTLRYFLEKNKPFNIIIEIGTYQGVSTAILSEYAERVHTFDVVDLPLRKEIFKDYNNIDFHLVESREKEIEMVNEIFKSKKVDLIFIDGEHFNGELEKDFDMCRKCSKILIHDYSPDFKCVYDFCNASKRFKEFKNTFCLLTGNEIDMDTEIDIKSEDVTPKKRGRKKKN